MISLKRTKTVVDHKEGVHKMNEWERLQIGLVYNDFDEDLFQRRVAAKKLFRAYRTKRFSYETRLCNSYLKVLVKMSG